MVLIEFFIIAVVIFLAMLCLKHDLDKKQKKLLDEMIKKNNRKCQSNQKTRDDTQRVEKSYANKYYNGQITAVSSAGVRTIRWRRTNRAR